MRDERRRTGGPQDLIFLCLFALRFEFEFERQCVVGERPFPTSRHMIYHGKESRKEGGGESRRRGFGFRFSVFSFRHFDSPA